METKQPDFKNKFSRQPKLPTLPIGIEHLLKVLADDNLTYPQLAEVIINHPNIVARLVALANSAWAASVVPITNLETACARLGLMVVRSTSIALAIASPFNPARCPGFSVERFWTTGILVSEGARMLAEKVKVGLLSDDDRGAAQTAGILHHFGLLWFADQMPEETSKALKSVTINSGISINQALRNQTYVDYTVVGAWIAREWGLPELLATPIEHHLDVQYKQQSWEMVLLVGSATRIATALHLGDNEVPDNYRLESLGISQMMQETVYQQLSKKYEGCREMARALFL
jgi:HD-like signal output (HDOD) protein